MNQEEISIIAGIIGPNDLTLEEANEMCKALPGTLFYAPGCTPERAHILRCHIDNDQVIATCLTIPDERILDADEAFRYLVETGKRLTDLHVNYEQAPEYPLEWIWKGAHVWRVQRMSFTDKNKTAIKVNDHLTLAGIPPEAHEYMLGGRSALEWILDQYQVTTDKRSGIVSDPNRADDPEYIARLVCRVVHVSVETARLTNEMARRVNFDDFDLNWGIKDEPLNKFWKQSGEAEQ